MLWSIIIIIIYCIWLSLPYHAIVLPTALWCDGRRRHSIQRRLVIIAAFGAYMHERSFDLFVICNYSVSIGKSVSKS